jgi:hypothetical protein
MKWELTTAYSAWFIFACISLGVLYAWVLYFYNQKNTDSLGGKVVYVLSLFRFLLVGLLSFLLLEPVIRHMNYVDQKPIMVMLVDDSKSMDLMKDSTQKIINKLNAIEESLSNDYQIDFIRFDESLHYTDSKTVELKGNETNIGRALREVKSQYFNQNLGGVVLVTDGIYNAGVNPLSVSENYNVPIYTIGMGDTNQYADLRIQDVECNSMAYLGSNYKCLVELKADKLKDKDATIQILINGSEVKRKDVFLSSNQFFKEVDFNLEATKIGVNRIDVKLTIFDQEKNRKNNSAVFYIDVIDGKRKVQIWSEMPHPDIGMMKSSIASNMNYEVQVKMNQFEVDRQLDLVILHNWFSSQSQLDLFEELKMKGVPVLCVVGDRFNPGYFNRGSQNIKFKSLGRVSNSTLPILNTEFSYFNVKEKAGLISQYPPLKSPYGNWQGFSSNDIFMYQKIGNVETSEPLWLMHDENSYRYGVISGTGLWQWKLADYEQNKNHDLTKLLFNQGLQYLSVKENKKLLKVQPIKSEFGTKEPVALQGELYNQGLEFVKGHEINVLLKDEQKKEYRYTMSDQDVKYSLTLNNLSPGSYNYVASAAIGSQKLSDNGSFVVVDLQKELMNQTADFDLLKRLAIKTDGRFYEPTIIDSLEYNLLSNKVGKTQILDQHKYTEFIRFRVLFWVIFLILSIEWFVRKWAGGY